MRQNQMMLIGDLVDHVVDRGTADAFDHMFLFAMKPPSKIRYPVVEGDRVDDQRISLPMGNRVAIERGIGIFRMRTSIGVDDAKIHRVFDEDYQPSRSLNQLHGPR